MRMRWLCVLFAALVACHSLCVMAAPSLSTPQIGNGYLATFVNTSDVFVAGVFNGFGASSQRAPFPSALRYFVEPFAFLSDETSSIELLTRLGTVRYIGLDILQPSLVAEHTWYAHRTRPHLSVEEIFVKDVNTASGTVTTVNLINFGTDGAAADEFSGASSVLKTYIATVSYLTKSLTVNVTAFETLTAENSDFFGRVTVCQVSSIPSMEILLNGTKGTTVRVFSTFCSNAPFDHSEAQGWAAPHAVDETCRCALDEIRKALRDEDALLTEHQAAWEQLWHHTITVTPSNSSASASEAVTLQNVIDGSFYSILSSMRGDSPYSTSPGGLSTNGYRGHAFWDMETWIFPSIALFHPEIANGSAVEYRLNRLQGAESNAVDVVNGSLGTAAFPWESAFTGYDACPWPQGEHTEIHITADVVIGWRMYYYLSLDRSFLTRVFDLLNHTAAFWLSRSTFDDKGNVWHLNGVTPPDEYHFGNDSVYTNAAAKSAVGFTLFAAQELNHSLPVEYRRRLQSLAANLTILFDAEEQYHPEFEGYDGTTIVKQADVILLIFPMGYSDATMTPTSVRNDLLYYENRSDPLGPAMTWSMFAVGYLSLDNRTQSDVDRGLYYLKRGYENNSFAPYWQWYEVAGGAGCPNFLTGAGGFLQSIWGGLLQLRVSGPGAVRLLPTATLPPGVSCVAAHKMSLFTSLVTVELCAQDDDSKTVTVTLDFQGAAAIDVNGSPLHLGVGVKLALNDAGIDIVAAR